MQWAYRRGIPRHLAEEIAQETAFRAFLNRDKYSGSAPVSSWLIGIARNVFREEARSSARHAPQASTLADDQTDPPSDDMTPEDATILRLAAEEALSRLTPDQRQAVQLTQIEHLPVSDAAHRMGKSPNAVRLLRSRALQSLGEYYEDFLS